MHLPSLTRTDVRYNIKKIMIRQKLGLKKVTAPQYTITHQRPPRCAIYSTSPNFFLKGPDLVAYALFNDLNNF